jgi:hypothetical protein
MAAAPPTIEIPLRAQPVDHDRDIDPLARVVEFEQVAVEHLMGFVGKVLRPDEEGDVVADVGLQQDAAEHRPFGIDVCRTLPGFERGNRRPTARPIIASSSSTILRPLARRLLVGELPA